MRLRHIEIFEAIYSSGSVTKAAEILHVSQPSVSKVLAHAEQQLGYLLFDRVRGKLVPTPEAHRLFDHVIAVNDKLDRLRSVADNLRTATEGTVRVAATPAFGFDLLPMAIASYRETRSDTFFTVETLHYDAVCKAVQESRVDIGLVFDPIPVSGIRQESVAQGNFVVLTLKDVDFGAKRSLSIHDLEGYPFINLDTRGPLGRLLSTHIDSSGVKLDIVASAETYHVAKSLVSHGVGVTITDEITAKCSGHDNVRAWPLTPGLPFKISALHSDRTPLSLVGKQFVSHFRDSVRQYLKQGT